MTLVALLFALAGMATAIGRHGRSPIHAFAALGMGSIMLGLLLAPGFSHFAAACLTMALALPLLLAAVGIRLKTRHRLGYLSRTALAVSVVDIGFMVVAAVLMPAHDSPPPLRLTSLMSAIHGDGALMAGGAAVWLVLLTWGLCAAVLVGPAALRHSPGGLFHVACSGCMIAAMAAMAA